MISLMDAVVQRVRTSWTKASRGGAGATRRNATPTAFLLPPNLRAGAHEVLMRESDAFHPSARELDFSELETIPRVVDGLLRIPPPQYSALATLPRSTRPPAVKLSPGQWLQWQVNYRIVATYGGKWHYRLDTFNIAYGPTRPDVFLGAPTRKVDERGFVL